MSSTATFERHEIKFLLTHRQQAELCELMEEHMQPDRFGRSTNCSLYFDTPDGLLIRRSMEHPLYKEKLRIRSYGVAAPDGEVYVELKKKYKGIVYKRRVPMACRDAEDWLSGKHRPPLQGQIIDEIDYCLSFYDRLAPTVYLSYEREAFSGLEDLGLRMTFDRDILWRDRELTLCGALGGAPLLLPGQRILEVKSSKGLPLWLIDFLNQEGLYKTSFSKYASAYRALLTQGLRGGRRSA